MTLIVTFGMFHSLLYLPVMLMLLGIANVGDGIEADIDNNDPVPAQWLSHEDSSCRGEENKELRRQSPFEST